MKCILWFSGDVEAPAHRHAVLEQDLSHKSDKSSSIRQSTAIRCCKRVDCKCDTNRACSTGQGAGVRTYKRNCVRSVEVGPCALCCWSDSTRKYGKLHCIKTDSTYCLTSSANQCRKKLVNPREDKSSWLYRRVLRLATSMNSLSYQNM